jgi:hypothetical protein
LGTTLGLLASLEDIVGEVPEARGNRQFRIYVHLKPNTIQTLDASQEFKRDPKMVATAPTPSLPKAPPVPGEWRSEVDTGSAAIRLSVVYKTGV